MESLQRSSSCGESSADFVSIFVLFGFFFVAVCRLESQAMIKSCELGSEGSWFFRFRYQSVRAGVGSCFFAPGF